uniref:Uncharacterized protein n=1 Tax=Lygus hesperus TaxID=30085 RepID=A0A146KV58_LYGHE
MKIEKQLLAKKVNKLLKDWRQESFSFTDCMGPRRRKRIETKDVSICDGDGNFETSSSNDDDGIDTDGADSSGRWSDNSYSRLIREGGEIVKHTFRFTVALCETSLVALSYLNIYHYIKKCRETSRYGKVNPAVPRAL